METTSRAGRVIGILLIVQMIGSGLVNFDLEAPLFRAPGFMVNAASHSQQIGLAALLGLATEASWLGIAITAFPVSFQRTRALTLWLTTLCVVVLAVAAIESIGVMSMVSLSEAYTNASGTEHEQFATARVVVSSARNWAHYLGRIFDGVAAFVFYTVLYRVKLIPRVLSGLGMMAALLMVAGVAMPLFGHDVVFPMLAPLGLAHLLVAVWLIARGFRDQPAIEGTLQEAG
jgi:hypothetical protein